MALPHFEENMSIITVLPDEPTASGGMLTAAFKAEFDRGGKKLQTYINETLIPAADSAIAAAAEGHGEGSQIGGDKIQDGAISSAKITDGAVGTVKIADSAVTTPKIANEAVTGAKIALDAIATAHIGDSQIVADKLAKDSVTTIKINGGAVTADKLAADIPLSKFTGDIANTVNGQSGTVVTRIKVDEPSASSAFEEDTTLADYPYRASIAVDGALATDMPVVNFTAAQIGEGIYASYAESYDGGVYIFCDEEHSAITVANIILER